MAMTIITTRTHITFFHRLLSLFTYLLIFSTTRGNAAPWPVHVRHSTHRVRMVGKRGLAVETYHPKSTFKTFGADGVDDGSAQPPVTTTDTSNLDVSGGVGQHSTWALNTSSMNFVRSQLGLSDTSKLGYKSGYSGDVAKFAYIKQYHEGIPFANAVANVAYNSNNKVISFGSSFITVDKTTTIAPSTPSMSWESVVPHIEDSLNGQYNNHLPSLEYLVRPDGSVSLTHVVQIQNEAEGHWYEAYICAHSGKLLSVADFVAHATYTVLPIQKEVLDSGLETLTDPEDTLGSPFGWHSDGSTNTTSTFGNNVMTFKTSPISQQRLITSESSDGLNFRFTFDDNQDPTDANNIAASHVNAFYVANTVHDVAYRYGFTEDAFNFQFSNLGRGGGNAKGGDGVLLSVQDLSGVNNANFATPPDGQSGICRMFIWNLTSIRRDGAMENDIVVHEMTHGITNRMTGGGTGRCLQTTEAAGLGEGWSDTMAEWVQHTDATVPDFAVGKYVTGNSNGIRHFPYSTDTTVNPLTYSHLQGLTEPHSIGEVWANMLHNVYAALVRERGFSTTALTNPDGQEGNVVFMRLFIDALAIQPCNPTFVAARDAWIQADQNRFSGIHRCTLFKAFASRGLGSKAQDNFVDDQSVPDDCNV
ncbi:hypothetical protein M378DRAFT_186614 [Amanita muscaria Koide BX008]|uniref:Extracellular metalloproteinase n=1 Tax=Amanita muscaria (strain Koide BX008) TaxID=946122 RepID=A0A0C2X6B0_AMAMK|nr:hypothetical protein M378DRAFT_186614 [Amanita muscaria Koide BX008]